MSHSAMKEFDISSPMRTKTMSVSLTSPQKVDQAHKECILMDSQQFLLAVWKNLEELLVVQAKHSSTAGLLFSS